MIIVHARIVSPRGLSTHPTGPSTRLILNNRTQRQTADTGAVLPAAFVYAESDMRQRALEALPWGIFRFSLMPFGLVA
jgi:hypothetical protein